MHSNESDYVQQILRKMIALERSNKPDWNLVSKLSDRGIQFIINNNLEPDEDDYIMKYLDDVDVRQKDYSYGEFQRKRIINILAGYNDGAPV